MPRLSCWFVRASLIYLAIGFTLGALLLVNKGLGFYPQSWLALPIHIETLLVGWFVQLALGVAFWILPRLKQGDRGNETLIRLAFMLLNLGVGLVVMETVFTVQGLAWVGRAAEIGGGLAFVIGLWRRIKPFAT